MARKAVNRNRKRFMETMSAELKDDYGLDFLNSDEEEELEEDEQDVEDEDEDVDDESDVDEEELEEELDEDLEEDVDDVESDMTKGSVEYACKIELLVDAVFDGNTSKPELLRKVKEELKKAIQLGLRNVATELKLEAIDAKVRPMILECAVVDDMDDEVDELKAVNEEDEDFEDEEDEDEDLEEDEDEDLEEDEEEEE